VPALPYNEVRLRRGWNLWTITIDPLDSEQDPAIPLREGWNTFGYSSPEPFAWASAMVSDGGESKTLDEAEKAGWLQATVYYFDNKTNLTGFVPGDDDSLRTNKAYWLFAKQDNLTLVLPGAGGSLVGNRMPWNDLDVIYGLETKSLSDAHDAGWLDAVIYYHDANDGTYKSLPADDQDIRPWKGYWIYSNLDGLKLQAPDSNGVASLFDSKAKAFLAAADQRRAEKASQLRLSRSQIKELADLTEGRTAKLGRAAPDFLLPDMAGNLIRLNEQNGSDILLVFGSTSCPHCADKVPLLNRIESSSKDLGIRVVFVALGANPSTARDYASRMNISFKVLTDAYGAAARSYNIRKVPEAFLLDKDGIIQYSSQEDGQVIWQLLEVRSSSPYSSVPGRENRG
jgi:peroxiredoxin